MILCLHINYKAHVSCNLCFIVKSEVLKVTGSHVHLKSGSTIENGARQRCCNNRKWYTACLKAAIAMTLGLHTSR